MAGTKQGGLKAAQKNLAGNPNFYAEIWTKGVVLLHLQATEGYKDLHKILNAIAT